MRSVDIKSYCRKHDNFRRYSVTDKKRLNDLTHLYSENKRFFGSRILEIACGAGVLGFIVARHGHEYLGIDKNPDMINEAVKSLDNTNREKIRFILGSL